MALPDSQSREPNAEHREVIKRIKIVLGHTEFTAWLIVREFAVWQAYLRDHTAEIRVRIIKRPNGLHDLAVVKSESCEVLKGFD